MREKVKQRKKKWLKTRKREIQRKIKGRIHTFVRETKVGQSHTHTHTEKPQNHTVLYGEG